MKEKYFVCKRKDGSVSRVAKRTEGKKYYGWDGKKWILMPQLRSIEYDITAFDEVSKEEAERCLKLQK